MPRPSNRAATPVRSAEVAFGKVLRTVRNDRGISQEELAFASGYHRTYIGQLERGEKSPSLRTLFNLAGALRTSPAMLVAEVEKSLHGHRR